jgi:hypothetical protein
MSLMDKIENIQKKPDYIKKRILFIAVLMIMFVIVAVWVSTLNITMGVEEVREKKEVFASPFAVIKDIVRQSFAKINFLDFNK